MQQAKNIKNEIAIKNRDRRIIHSQKIQFRYEQL